MPRASLLISANTRLEAALFSGDENKIVNELRQIRSKKSSRLARVRQALDVLQRAKSPRVRNAAAIALADMKGIEATDVLVDMLRRQEIKNSRGTLLYALDQLGADIPVDVLIELILHDSYEARQEAVNLIEKGRAVWSDNVAPSATKKLESALSSDDEELRDAAGRVIEYVRKRYPDHGLPSSTTYRSFERAMRARKQILCMYDGYPRELCPVILGHSQGQEKALTFQFGGQSKSGLPRGGEWRCLFLSKVSKIQLRKGPWMVGLSHTRPQGCVDVVDLDVNPSSPYQPKRQVTAIGQGRTRRAD